MTHEHISGFISGMWNAEYVLPDVYTFKHVIKITVMCLNVCIPGKKGDCAATALVDNWLWSAVCAEVVDTHYTLCDEMQQFHAVGQNMISLRCSLAIT